MLSSSIVQCECLSVQKLWTRYNKEFRLLEPYTCHSSNPPLSVNQKLNFNPNFPGKP